MLSILGKVEFVQEQAILQALDQGMGGTDGGEGERIEGHEELGKVA